MEAGTSVPVTHIIPHAEPKGHVDVVVWAATAKVDHAVVGVVRRPRAVDPRRQADLRAEPVVCRAVADLWIVEA